MANRDLPPAGRALKRAQSPGAAVRKICLRAFPERCWTPAYWGKFGWTHVRIEGTRAAELRHLLEGSWQLVSQKR